MRACLDLATASARGRLAGRSSVKFKSIDDHDDPIDNFEDIDAAGGEENAEDDEKYFDVTSSHNA